MLCPYVTHLLCVDAAQFQGAGHAINRHNICGDTIIHPVGFGVKHNLIETLLHHVLQAFIHFALAPEKTLAILHPLEVADGDATSITENVPDDEDSLFFDDWVGVGSGWAVSALAQDFAFDAVSVFRGDLIFSGSGNKNLAGMEKDLLRAHLLAPAGKIGKRLALAVDPFDEFGDVETSFVIKSAVNIRDADDFIARLVHQVGSLRADVTKTLDNDARAVTLHAEFLNCLVAADHKAAAGRFGAALGATEFKWLACDDSGGGLAEVHGVGVHHPGHRLRVGANVGRRNVALGTKPFAQLGCVAASDALNFGF